MNDSDQVLKMLVSNDTEMRNLGAVLAFTKGHDWICENLENLDAEGAPLSRVYSGVVTFVDPSGFKLIYIPFTLRGPMNWWWTKGEGCLSTTTYNIP